MAHRAGTVWKGNENGGDDDDDGMDHVSLDDDDEVLAETKPISSSTATTRRRASSSTSTTTTAAAQSHSRGVVRLQPIRLVDGVPVLASPGDVAAVVQRHADAVTAAAAASRAATAVSPDDSDFGDFHSAHDTGAQDAHAGAHTGSPTTETLAQTTRALPPLYQLLNDEQKVAFAALCLQTLTELGDRHYKFEYIPPVTTAVDATRRSSRASLEDEHAVSTPLRKSISRLSIVHRSGSRDDRPLLERDDGDDDEDSETEEDRRPAVLVLDSSVSEHNDEHDDKHNHSSAPEHDDTPLHASLPPRATSFHGSLDQLAASNALHKRKPFAELMDREENIEDLVHLGKPIDGNVALCYAIRTHALWSKRVLDHVYKELRISAKEHVFIEQSVAMGLRGEKLAKPFMPKTPATSPSSSESGEPFPAIPTPPRASIGNLDTSLLPSPSVDPRPYVLWNLALILLAIDGGHYDARSRAFLRRMAVDQLRYGTWVDIIEDIETPMTMLPLEYITATAGLAAGASVVATRETSSIPAVTSPTSSTQKAIQHSVSLHKSVSAAATSSASDIVTTTGTGTSMNSFTGHSHDAVTASKSSMVLRNGEMERLAKKETRSRTALMAAAAVGGGVIIGVSAGLAAPMVGAGIGALLTAVKIAGTTSFLTGVGGTALITSAGVITGSSIAGSKMAKRTAGIEVFRFIPINESERRNVIISVSGWVTSKKSKSSAVLKGGNDGGGARSRSASAASNRSKDERDGVSASTSKADGASKDDSTGEADKTAEGMETAEGDDADEILATGLDDLVVPFMGVSPLMGSHYALCFDPHILCGLGDSLNIFASEILSFTTTQILQQTILATVLSALTWPMWLVKLGHLVDNPWSTGMDRARKAGLILADALCNNVQGDRPVTLVGFSLGAKTIYHCLVELASRGKYGIIEDVYIFGAPLLVPRVLPSQQPSTKPETASSKGKASSSTPPPVDYTLPQHMQSLDEWRKAVSVVSGTLVNCFTRTDWVLGYLFRGSVAGMYDVAGLNPVVLDEEETPDVEILQADEFAPKDASVDPEHGATYKTISEEDRERKLRERPRTVRNIDISELVPGHSHYRNAMPMLVKRVCGFATWTESVEVIEEVVMGEWMEDVDGWWKTEKERLKAVRTREQKAAKAKREPEPKTPTTPAGDGPRSL